MPDDCVICLGPDGDDQLMRTQVWEDDLWRLTTSVGGEVLGFSYLEPKRHIPYVTDLDGEEARTFGTVLARASAALERATAAELVYVYVFGGGIAHLHVHLAPHREGDALNTQMIRGEIEERKLPSGAVEFTSKEFPPLPPEEHGVVVERVRDLLSIADRPTGQRTE